MRRPRTGPTTRVAKLLEAPPFNQLAERPLRGDHPLDRPGHRFSSRGSISQPESSQPRNALDVDTHGVPAAARRPPGAWPWSCPARPAVASLSTRRHGRPASSSRVTTGSQVLLTVKSRAASTAPSRRGPRRISNTFQATQGNGCMYILNSEHSRRLDGRVDCGQCRAELQRSRRSRGPSLRRGIRDPKLSPALRVDSSCAARFDHGELGQADASRECLYPQPYRDLPFGERPSALTAR